MFWVGLCLLLFGWQEAGATTWPISGSQANYDALSGTFGECRSSPAGSNNCNGFHGGIDIFPTLNCGNTVYAAISGTATFSFNNTGGYTVTIDDKYDYAHLSTHTFPATRYVTEGSSIGLTSNSPYTSSFECHLHFETWELPTGWSTSLFYRKNPLLKFAIPDSTPGRIGEVLLRQTASSASVTAGTVLNLSGAAELLVEGADGSNRFLPILGSTTSVNWARFRAILDTATLNQDFYFGQVPVNGAVPDPAQASDVYSLLNPASTFSPFKTWYRMGNIFYLSEGWHYLCIKGYDLSGSQFRLSANTCFNFAIDRVQPDGGMRDGNGASLFDGGASSMTTLTVTSTDTYGLARIAISGPTSDSRNVSGLTATETFAGLSEGQYTAVITDLASNQRSMSAIIKISVGATDNKDEDGNALPGIFTSTYCVAGHAVDSSGIASITIASDLPDTTAFDCTPARKSTDAVGHLLCELASGAHETTSVNCAGVPGSSTFTVTVGTNTGRACLDGSCSNFTPAPGSSTTISVNTTGSCGGCSLAEFCERVVLSPLTSCRTTGGGLPFVAEYIAPCPRPTSFSIVNPTTTTWSTILQVNAGTVGNTVFFNDVVPPSVSTSHAGSVSIPQRGSICPTSNSANTATVSSSYRGLVAWLASLVGDLLLATIRQNLAYVPGSLNGVFGSDVILTSSGTVTFSLPNPSSIIVSTSTMAIYRFDGVDWTSAAVTNQTVSKDPSTSVISATGSIITSGYYALLFNANDSSAPITTLSFQGTSFSFDGTLFVSTDAFIVLTATDPAVSGYASTVASITYRLDPSSGSPFYIYTSSIALPLGTHVFEYRSLDYAGNVEVIQTATFTVTAGTAFRTTNTAQVPGVLLNGFLGSGAKLEIESQAQNSLTLLISSVNRQGLISVDNIGEVGIGVAPQANLNIGQGSIGVQLRSGNSTSAVTSNQIAFGYNGDYSMRHLLRTEHSTAAHTNKMDFLVWNTGTGSTATVANLSILSLQGIATASGGSFHVQPVGEPDAEVEVSNGLTTGGGTMQRLQVVSPSSRRFKMDLKDLNEREEERALEEVAGLKHVRFRYKSRRKDGRLSESPTQPIRTGLIYEEAPESIRDGDDALSTTERLVNVEMALKASMRRLEELQKRYEQLKARRKNP